MWDYPKRVINPLIESHCFRRYKYLVGGCSGSLWLYLKSSKLKICLVKMLCETENDHHQSTEAQTLKNNDAHPQFCFTCHIFSLKFLVSYNLKCFSMLHEKKVDKTLLTFKVNFSICKNNYWHEVLKIHAQLANMKIFPPTQLFPIL